MPADWTLTATPVAITGQGTVSGNGDPTSAGGVNQVTVFSGSYTLTESGPDGFTAGNWVCVGARRSTGNIVDVPNGGNVVCEITNTAVAPTLTLVKIVDNGTTGATTLRPPSGRCPLTDRRRSVVRPGIPAVTAAPVKVGTYNLSESGPSGLHRVGLGVHRRRTPPLHSVTLAEGHEATCTITNTAIVPRLTLVKVVDNGTTGRTSVPADFTLTA